MGLIILILTRILSFRTDRILPLKIKIQIIIKLELLKIMLILLRKIIGKVTSFLKNNRSRITQVIGKVLLKRNNR